MKGRIHVAPSAYTSLLGELSYFNDYLNRRLMPQEPEDVYLAHLLLALQNILEYEIELAIASFVKKNPTKQDLAFAVQVKTGFVSFKTKFTWAHSRGIVSDAQRDIMEQVRMIRNAQTHFRPSKGRKKYKYFGKPLFTRRSLVALMTGVNGAVLHLRGISGNKERWEIIPPGYASEMGWV